MKFGIRRNRESIKDSGLQDGKYRSVTKKASDEKTPIYIEENLGKETAELNQKYQWSNCTLPENNVNELNAELFTVSAERDALLERVRALNEAIDWLSTENEGQQREIKRLRDVEKEADELRIEYCTIKCRYDKLKKGHDTTQVSSIEEPSTAETLLAMLDEITVLATERDVFKTHEEVAARENSMSRKHAVEMRGAWEGTDLRVEGLKDPVVSLSSASEDNQHRVEHEGQQVNNQDGEVRIEEKDSVIEEEIECLSDSDDDDGITITIRQEAVVPPTAAGDWTITQQQSQQEVDTRCVNSNVTHAQLSCPIRLTKCRGCGEAGHTTESCSYRSPCELERASGICVLPTQFDVAAKNETNITLKGRDEKSDEVAKEPKRCPRCYVIHVPLQCPSRFKTCYYCGQLGHTIQFCNEKRKTDVANIPSLLDIRICGERTQLSNPSKRSPPYGARHQSWRKLSQQDTKPTGRVH